MLAIAVEAADGPPGEATVRHAHDPAAPVELRHAEDFLRWRSAESLPREGWRSEARQLVVDARRGLGEAKDAVRLMRNAVLS